MIVVYMLLGLALVGGLYWALTQFTLRQRAVTAELSRLEQLTAEVSMNVEALLERVDERTERLDERAERLAALLAMVEARAEATVPAPAPAVAPAPAAASGPAPSPPKKGGRSRKQPKPEAEPAAQAPPVPAPIQRYQELRSAVWALVDQGKEAGAIAQELGLPRGEVLLLINLRAKNVTA